MPSATAHAAASRPAAQAGLLTALRQWWRLQGARAEGRLRLNLALQGGGAHGAFTWGVLDALLEDPRTGFAALSGSSAGAVNAVLMAQGWMQGGRQGARDALAAFWMEVGARFPWPLMTTGQGPSLSLSAATRLLAQWLGRFAPGEFNPLDINPLRDSLVRLVDFEALRRHSPFQLFIAATQVNTARLRLFREHELSVDRVLASSCLPRLHHTVHIDGEPYWDGGYCANPAVFPLLEDGRCHDILLVLLAPRQHRETPHSVEAIETRVQELGFQSHFLREMQMYARFLGPGRSPRDAWRAPQPALRRKRFHLIDVHELDFPQRSDTKVLAYAPFLEMLRDLGRARAQQWLAQNAGHVGRRGTLDWSQWAA